MSSWPCSRIRLMISAALASEESGVVGCWIGREAKGAAGGTWLRGRRRG
jgi:hypothetical protein